VDALAEATRVRRVIRAREDALQELDPLARAQELPQPDLDAVAAEALEPLPRAAPPGLVEVEQGRVDAREAREQRAAEARQQAEQELALAALDRRQRGQGPRAVAGLDAVEQRLDLLAAGPLRELLEVGQRRPGPDEGDELVGERQRVAQAPARAARDLLTTPSPARIPSFSNTARRRAAISGSGRSSSRTSWQRETKVGRSFSGSVVAKKSFTCGGGSSSVFRKALTASFVSMCVSSTMKILKRARIGR